MKVIALCCSLLVCLPSFSQELIRAVPQRMESRLQVLSQFGATPEGGVSRPGYGAADLEARAYIIKVMDSLGLQVQIDAAGNIIGRRGSSEAGLPYISFGSHIDSVPFGGKYDGNVGVIGALECIELLNEHQLTTRHPLEVIVFAAEEDGLFGSKGMIGALTADELKFVVNSGKTVEQGINDVGGNTDQLPSAARKKGEIRAFLELHIEQGAILEQSQTDIGVVEGIVGIEEWGITVEGLANHSGTTPMNIRKDALLAASKLVLVVNDNVRAVEGAQVGTIGEFRLEPNVSNVVPGRVDMTLEMRDLDTEKTLRIFDRIREQSLDIARDTGTDINFNHQLSNVPAFTDAAIQQLITASARDLGLSYRLMPSGAGHDAQDIAKIAPVGMIFVPSKAGVSHAPEEFTSAQDMANGASVLLYTVLKLDNVK